MTRKLTEWPFENGQTETVGPSDGLRGSAVPVDQLVRSPRLKPGAFVAARERCFGKCHVSVGQVTIPGETAQAGPGGTAPGRGHRTGRPQEELIRQFPDKLQVRGNRTSIQPPRELHSLGGHLIARLFRFDRFRKAIRSIFSSCRHTSPVVLTRRRCPRPTLEWSLVADHRSAAGFL